ncbi:MULTISPECIES: radical SAM protein [Acidobacteriaceae]|uniref:SPL family radical SAM protein n=1 Tax=Acidobacteriaceae TaxID=204434 RepID=UPI00131AFB03|nr:MULTISPECIES: radical SAM protein [Acidobacteriaceae]MDW5264581.1 radical SAM protein [Edaphobacter sp.]
MANKLRQEDTALFPILPQPTGIARLASHAEHADDGHLIEFKALEVRSILNKSTSKRLRWLAWSINPYRGCEFGCKYCYARYTHEFMELRDPLAFERIIFLKQNAAWLLEQELRKIDPADEIAIGTATDPYQPIERRARITRSLLEVFARRQGYRLGIVTKSRLIERDIDLLTEIAKRNKLVLHITITTPNTELARLLEPRAPRPDLRFQAVKRLREAGLRTGILCCPLLPGITDTQEALNEMARRAAEVGANFLSANPLFLKPCSRPTYLSFVREHFPSLVDDYHKRFDHADFAAPAYRQKLALMLEQARHLHGLSRRPLDVLPQPGNTVRKPPESVGIAVQQSLFA